MLRRERGNEELLSKKMDRSQDEVEKGSYNREVRR